ncbi:hypothetical protein FBU30_005595 [Linnemannia zychae]|nr:hypothetical protein FBU30_005595 [Linnemannia zychae]
MEDPNSLSQNQPGDDNASTIVPCATSAAKISLDSTPPTLRSSRVRLALIIFSLFLSAFLASLDISIIATALPRIASELGAQSQMSWVASIYLLTYTIFQPIYGRFADIFGRKPMYLFGSSVFFIGSVGCGAASSMMMLILFRAIQGLGGAGLFALVFIIMSDIFPKAEERARAVAFLLLGMLYQLPFERTNLRQKLARIDYLGLIFVIATVICLLLPLTWGGTTYPWRSPVIISLIVAFALLLAVMVYVESRAAEAIIPPALFLNKNITIVMLLTCYTGVVFMGFTFYLPLYFQVVDGASTTESGLRLMPSVLGASLTIIASGFLLKKIKDYRYFIWIGLATMTLGVGLTILNDVGTPVGQQVGCVLIMGIGQGLIFQNAMLASQDAAPENELAVVTALFGFFDSIGGAIGVAVSAAAFNNALIKNMAKMTEETRKIAFEHKVVDDINAVEGLPTQAKIEVLKAYAEAFQFLFIVLTPILGFVLAIEKAIDRRVEEKIFAQLVTLAEEKIAAQIEKLTDEKIAAEIERLAEVKLAAYKKEAEKKLAAYMKDHNKGGCCCSSERYMDSSMETTLQTSLKEKGYPLDHMDNTLPLPLASHRLLHSEQPLDLGHTHDAPDWSKFDSGATRHLVKSPKRLLSPKNFDRLDDMSNTTADSDDNREIMPKVRRVS